jgi:tetratricopeptide (TPR) repeat protein
MYSLLLSLGAGVVVALALRLGTAFGWVAAVFPGLLVTTVVYVLLGFRVRKKFDELQGRIMEELKAGRIEPAVQVLKGGLALAPWQFGVESQVYGGMGIYRYFGGDLDAALPDLERGCPTGALAKLFNRDWTIRAVLGCARYRKRDVAGALALMEEAVKVGEKDGLPWSIYAWMLEKEGRHDEAIRVLGRAATALPKDEKVKDSLQALQNGKKLRLWKLYDLQWYQFRLETPPAQMDPAAGRSRRQLFRRR